MTRPILFAACAALALAAGPGAGRAAMGSAADPAAVTGCRQQVRDRAEQSPVGEWRERLGDWLRKQRLGDQGERGGYYLRSPLLYAFGPEAPEDCARREASRRTAGQDAADVTADSASGLLGRVRPLGPRDAGQDAEPDQHDDAHTDPGR